MKKFSSDVIFSTAFLGATCLYSLEAVPLIISANAAKVVTDSILTKLTKKNYISSNSKKVLEVVLDPTWALMFYHFEPILTSQIDAVFKSSYILPAVKEVASLLPNRVSTFLANEGAKRLSAAITTGIVSPIIQKTSNYLMGKGDDKIIRSVSPIFKGQLLSQFFCTGPLGGKVASGFMSGLVADYKGLDLIKWSYFNSANYTISKVVQEAARIDNGSFWSSFISNQAYWSVRKSLDEFGKNHKRRGIDIFLASSCLAWALCAFCPTNEITAFINANALLFMGETLLQVARKNELISDRLYAFASIATSVVLNSSSFEQFRLVGNSVADAFNNFSISNQNLNALLGLVSPIAAANAAIVGGIFITCISIQHELADYASNYLLKKPQNQEEASSNKIGELKICSAAFYNSLMSFIGFNTAFICNQKFELIPLAAGSIGGAVKFVFEKAYQILSGAESSISTLAMATTSAVRGGLYAELYSAGKPSTFKEAVGYCGIEALAKTTELLLAKNAVQEKLKIE